MTICFAIVHTHVSIYNANAYEALNDIHKYFTFGSLICTFTYINPVSQVPNQVIIYQSDLLTTDTS